MTSFRLEFDQGGELQTVSFEKDSISLGRDRSSDFVIDHPTVSRQHALIVNEGAGDFRLVVLSRGGLTAIDGDPVEAEEVPLYDGTVVTLGQHSVRFRSENAREKPTTPAAAADSEPEEEEDGAGIQSWEEIAAGPEEDDEVEQAGVKTFRQARESSDEEETSPAIVVAGLLGALVLLGVAVFGGGDSGEVQQAVEEEVADDSPPVEVEIDCHTEPDCLDEAEQHYQRGVGLLERHAVETGNLFDGYHRLLMAKTALERAGVEELPAEMDDLERLHDDARERLDDRFRQMRMRYHQASQAEQFWEMADILDEVQTNFPDRTADEHRWAGEQIREMQSAGTYPRRR